MDRAVRIKAAPSLANSMPSPGRVLNMRFTASRAHRKLPTTFVANIRVRRASSISLTRIILSTIRCPSGSQSGQR